MLILIKHAMPLLQPDVDARDWLLSPAGREQCGVLAARLAPHEPRVMVASAEPKASETGRIAAALLGLPFTVAEGLHEHDRRGVPLLPAVEFQQSVRRFFNEPAALVFGRETADQAWQRFNAAVTRLLEQHEDQSCIAVVSHGTVISLFVARATGMEPFPLWQRLGLPSFVVLERPRLRLLDLVDNINA